MFGFIIAIIIFYIAVLFPCPMLPHRPASGEVLMTYPGWQKGGHWEGVGTGRGRTPPTGPEPLKGNYAMFLPSVGVSQ